LINKVKTKKEKIKEMEKLIRKYYDLPRVDNHFVEKTAKDLVDGDLIAEFFSYKSQVNSDFIMKKSAQKNLYKVYVYEESKKSVLADGKTIAVVFDKPVGLLTFDFLFCVATKVKIWFSKAYESYYFSSATTRYIGYFFPSAYNFKEGISVIKTFAPEQLLVCLKDPDIILEQSSRSLDKSDDFKYFFTMNYSSLFEPITTK